MITEKDIKELIKEIENKFYVKITKNVNSIGYKEIGDSRIYFKLHKGKSFILEYKTLTFHKLLFKSENEIDNQEILKLLEDFLFIRDSNTLKFIGEPKDYFTYNLYFKYDKIIYDFIDFGKLKKLDAISIPLRTLDLSKLEEVNYCSIHLEYIEKIKRGNCKMNKLHFTPSDNIDDLGIDSSKAHLIRNILK